MERIPFFDGIPFKERRKMLLVWDIACGRFPWNDRKEWDEFLQLLNEFYEGVLDSEILKKIESECCYWVDANKLLPPSGKWVLVAITYHECGAEFCTWAKANWQQRAQMWDIPYTGISNIGKVTHWRFVDSPYETEKKII